MKNASCHFNLPVTSEFGGLTVSSLSIFQELAQSHHPSFYEVFVFFVLICGSFLYHLPINTSPAPSSENRAGGGGLSPPENLGFLRNVLMRRQAASPRFLLWAFWGHSLARPPHQEGSTFRERVPRKKKGWVGILQTPAIVCKTECDGKRVRNFAPICKDIGHLQTQEPQFWCLPRA